MAPYQLFNDNKVPLFDVFHLSAGFHCAQGNKISRSLGARRIDRKREYA